MATSQATVKFFTDGTFEEYEKILELYPQALKLKADNKGKKPEELEKLDNWYQNELPKKIKSRGKDAHMVHEELVQTMKWKQTRGKFYPQISYLVKVNTPRMVMQETKKAFKKLPNLEQALAALNNLKGVGTTLASALLAAACPESAPFMADECLNAIPDFETIEYTTREYLKFAQHIAATADRLNVDGERLQKSLRWSPHKVELAIWTHSIVSELKPELLDDTENGTPELATIHQNGNSSHGDADSSSASTSNEVVHQNGSSLHGDGTPSTSDDSNSGGGSVAPPPLNGKSKSSCTNLSAAVLDEDTRDTVSTMDTDNNSPVAIPVEDEIGENSTSVSSVSESNKESLQGDDSNSITFPTKRPLESIDGPPSSKKAREAAK